MFFIQPVFMPVHHEPARCPNCNEIENTETICKHCKYVYEEEDDNLDLFMAAALIVVFAAGAIGAIFPEINPMVNDNLYGHVEVIDRVMSGMMFSMGTVMVLVIGSAIIWALYTLFTSIKGRKSN